MSDLLYGLIGQSAAIGNIEMIKKSQKEVIAGADNFGKKA